ncbi:chalcone isomerase family protein [Colwellia sp. BRX10-3]|uniref:chalcone isomerase family protein n=1 Tax=Colwellia sp. BRX10-3 TaxID=2759844 RepID=UPI0015F54062|nr:chalcone isomerase family protein [Colwellia sp. BRX10-3]MBA6390994.1 chalcone isomerase family protein [Colwellia sp. BRX10-3]
MPASFNILPTFAILVCLWSLNAAGGSAIQNTVKSNILSDDQSKISQIVCGVDKSEPLIFSDLTKTVTEQHFTLLGKAKFSVLFWDIYESSLLTTDGQRPFSNTCQHSLFEIHYLRAISKKELLDNTISQWQHLSINENEYSAFLPLLENIWLDINAGDRLSMLNQKGTTIFYLNRKYLGEIQSVTFAKTFLGIWLDENTSEPKLRLKLLGDSI